MRYLPVIATLLPLAIAGQGRPIASVRADTTVLRLGEQVHLTLTIDHPSTARSVQWPAIGDTLTRHIEVLADSGVDSTQGGHGLMRQLRSITITSFDSGFQAIPPFTFIVDGIPTATEALLLEVRSVPADSSNTVRDIKDIHTLPFSMAYWVRKHLVPLLGIAVALLALVLAIRYIRQRKHHAPPPMEPEVLLPLHERVLAALDLVESQRLWQQGDHKGYHTRITDLLRGYIEERYRVPAMECTTDEVLNELRISPLNADQRSQLESMLRLADMVKFAKNIPSPQENERMIIAARGFVQETAQRTAPDDPHAR